MFNRERVRKSISYFSLLVNKFFKNKKGWKVNWKGLVHDKQDDQWSLDTFKLKRWMDQFLWIKDTKRRLKDFQKKKKRKTKQKDVFGTLNINVLFSIPNSTCYFIKYFFFTKYKIKF